MSLNDAAYAVGFEATEYRSGLTKPTPFAVAPFDWHVEDSLVTARSAAQIGAADEVPPNVCQPPYEWSYTVIPPVNSSAWALTSGTSRHAPWFAPAGLSVRQNL